MHFRLERAVTSYASRVTMRRFPSLDGISNFMDKGSHVIKKFPREIFPLERDVESLGKSEKNRIKDLIFRILRAE